MLIIGCDFHTHCQQIAPLRLSFPARYTKQTHKIRPARPNPCYTYDARRVYWRAAKRGERQCWWAEHQPGPVAPRTSNS
jgi:hypothetical protein